VKIFFGQPAAVPVKKPAGGPPPKRPRREPDDLAWLSSKLRGPYPEETFKWMYTMARQQSYVALGYPPNFRNKDPKIDRKASKMTLTQTLPAMLGVTPQEMPTYNRFLEQTLGVSMAKLQAT
jgi:hypothetical protein